MNNILAETIEDRIHAAELAAIAQHVGNPEVLAYLSKRRGHFKNELGTHQRYIEGNDPVSQQAAIVGRRATLNNMESFYSVWRDTAPENAPSLLYTQTLPPQPTPPSAAEIYAGTMAKFRRIGILFTIEGHNLGVTPASLLDDNDRAFIKRNKKDIMALVIQEADQWLV